MTEKLYYSIGEVARMLDVNPSLIRFWEKEFHFLRPHKNKKGNRLFTANDIDQLKTIHHLVKEKGYTIPGARNYLSAHQDEAGKHRQVIKSLEEIKRLLLEIGKELP